MKSLLVLSSALLLCAGASAHALDLPGEMTPSGEKFVSTCSDAPGTTMTRYRASVCERLLKQWHMEAYLRKQGVANADLTRVSGLAAKNQVGLAGTSDGAQSPRFLRNDSNGIRTAERFITPNTAAGSR